MFCRVPVYTRDFLIQVVNVLTIGTVFLWLSRLFQQMICFGFIPCTKSTYALIYSCGSECHLLLDASSKSEERPQWPATQSSWSYYPHSGNDCKGSLWSGVLFSPHNLHICLSLYPNFHGTLLFLPPTSYFSILLLHGNSLPWFQQLHHLSLSLQLSLLTSPFRLLIGWAVTVVRMIKSQSGVALWPRTPHVEISNEY